jgi:thioredoxin 1
MIKKIIPVFFISLLAAFFILGYVYKDKMNNYLSERMKENSSVKDACSTASLIDSLYNYSKNRLNYKITFLEFGSKGCRSCKRMEKVMREISEIYSNSVNIAFHNVMKPENKKLMKYFGIVSIPSQVLLDKTGKEIFRHNGYFSTEELAKEITKHGIEKHID